MKKAATMFFSFVFTAVSVGFFPMAANAGYEGQIVACLEARKKGQAKTIQDYVCPEGIIGDQDVAYQVVLDLEFKKIDKDADSRLRSMQSQMGKDFVTMDHEIVNAFDTTSEKSEFPNRYGAICSDLNDPKSVLRQTVDAFDASKLGSVTTDSATSSFAGNRKWCDALTANKLAAYKSASRLFAEQNVVESYVRDKNEFTGALKKEYGNFLMKWMVYIGEISRIKSKWPNKTPKHNSQ